MKRIYLDHNATTPMSRAAADLMRSLADEDYGNPSSIHWAGAGAGRYVKAAREEVARLLCVRPGEVVFTGGGTEADIAALWSMVMTARERDPGKTPRIAALCVEHPAIVSCLAQFERLGLATWASIAVDETGRPTRAALRAGLSDASGLCAMWANNETGTLLDLEMVADAVQEAGVDWHCDAVQAIGKRPIDLSSGPGASIATLAVAAHKFHGPKGVGALIVRGGKELVPLLPGGAQEGGRRSGTLNVPGIAALGVAAEEARLRLESGASTRPLRDALEARLMALFPGSCVNGHPTQRLPNTLNISIMGEAGDWADGESLMLGLSQLGIAVSTGAACAAGSRKPSRVLTAMGISPAQAHASLRFSFGHDHTLETVESVVASVVEVAASGQAF